MEHIRLNLCRLNIPERDMHDLANGEVVYDGVKVIIRTSNDWNFLGSDVEYEATMLSSGFDDTYLSGIGASKVTPCVFNLKEGDCISFLDDLNQKLRISRVPEERQGLRTTVPFQWNAQECHRAEIIRKNDSGIWSVKWISTGKTEQIRAHIINPCFPLDEITSGVHVWLGGCSHELQIPVNTMVRKNDHPTPYPLYLFL